MNDIRASNLRMVGFALPALGLNTLVTAVFGFDPELGSNNTAEALDRLRYLIVASPVLAYGIVVGLLRRYPISRERQRKMRGIIEERERLALDGAADS